MCFTAATEQMRRNDSKGGRKREKHTVCLFVNPTEIILRMRRYLSPRFLKPLAAKVNQNYKGETGRIQDDVHDGYEKVKGAHEG